MGNNSGIEILLMKVGLKNWFLRANIIQNLRIENIEWPCVNG